MPVDGTAVEAQDGGGDATRIGRRTVLGAAASMLFLAGFNRAALALPRGERRLLLYNPHTDERFADVFWCDGSYVPDSLKHINWLMRDFHRDAVSPIDVDLLQLLHRIAQRIDAKKPFRILSGYRTAATNRLLKREGWAPAAHSEHLVGKAADICMDRVSLRHLHRAAVSLKGGGVGMYPRDHFIHVDVGPVRVW
ncbi:MAG TPA: DUF882 domain-containing protein [Stellaceae bacterium]|nr:DUF882 domain-containing protein [Stellaceae bacterium]